MQLAMYIGLGLAALLIVGVVLRLLTRGSGLSDKQRKQWHQAEKASINTQTKAEAKAFQLQQQSTKQTQQAVDAIQKKATQKANSIQKDGRNKTAAQLFGKLEKEVEDLDG